MNGLGLTFHHIGLAVSRVEDALTFVRELGYNAGPTVIDPLQKVQSIICTHPVNPAIEILAPETPGASSPISELTKKNPLGVVYHTCYATTDLASTLARVQALGLSVHCISEPKPAVLFGGRKVSFYRISGMGLVEIMEP